ncbi:hypothetical protein BN990_01800 [Virgibacillus salexigens]|uniref:Uncharacterized protein n=1 Tax=Virgibacillus massiliensis TaxID=1462526 RepID=A0A024QBE5_9BACI|nr:hypothetical protein BN990_01800 [Virgibacillus massiliensis]
MEIKEIVYTDELREGVKVVPIDGGVVFVGTGN